MTTLRLSRLSRTRRRRVRGRLIVVTGAPDVVETEIADDASRDRQELLRTALDALPDGVAVLSSGRDRPGRIADFRYEYANEALSGRLASVPGS